MAALSLAACKKKVQAQANPADAAAFLGLAETDLTPAVQGALTALLAEVAIPMAEVTADVIAAQVASAEADLADAKPGEATRKATEVINQLKALQSTL